MLLPEGEVVFDGADLVSPNFWLRTASGSGAMVYGSNDLYPTGRLIFKNYTSYLRLGKVSSAGDAYLYGLTVINCVWHLYVSTGYCQEMIGCTFIDSPGDLLFNFQTAPNANIKGNTFINSNFKISPPTNTSLFIDNFFDANSYFDNIGTIGFGLIDNNCFLDALKYKNVNYANLTALQLALPTEMLNSLGEATVPLFNQVNSLDYTLQEASPLVKAGFGKVSIGSKKVAAAFSTDDAAGIWTFTGIDGSVAGEAILTGSPTGTAETLIGQPIAGGKKREIDKITLPDVELNLAAGETVGNLAADNTPNLFDIEIQYSDLLGSGYSSWLRVPYGAKPLHDTTNDVGNDDSLFDISTAIPIFCKYLKFKITLRDNEVPV